MTPPARTPLGAHLPDFPWDTLAEAKATAERHPDGIVNLSVGTPVDEVAPSIQQALADATRAPTRRRSRVIPKLWEPLSFDVPSWSGWSVDTR